MSYRFTQPSPQSTRCMNWKISVHGPADELTEKLWSTSEKFRDVQLLRSWFELDTEVDRVGSRSRDSRDRIDWNAVVGFAVMAVVSGGFWTGLGLLIARLG
jgi:hypothetical protein